MLCIKWVYYISISSHKVGKDVYVSLIFFLFFIAFILIAKK